MLNHAPSPAGARTGGQILVDILRLNGVNTVFGVPGESYLAVLDALHEAAGAIRFVTCRQEGGAAFMAEAWSKLTSQIGVCFVTRGPGATNASIGVHVAAQDSTPMILFIGQVARDQMDREAFQEIDYHQMFGGMAKWVAQIERADRMAEYVTRAISVAQTGRPGPVVLALPEDMLTETAPAPAGLEPARIPHAAPPADAIAELRGLLAKAERPLAILGGSGWTEAAVENIAAFLHANRLPAGTAFRRADLLDNRDPLYVGDVGIGINPRLAARVREADLLLVIGDRLSEITTSGYTLLTPPVPHQTLIHVHPGPDELNRVYRARLPICAHAVEAAVALAEMEPVDGARWAQWAAEGRAEYEDWIRPGPCPGAINLPELYRWMREDLPEDMIVTNGAGNFASWLHRYYEYRSWPSQCATAAGAMGYGLPAAVAAKAAFPDRLVVNIAGDGDFLMNGQEFMTAVQHGLPIIVLVMNNGMYGTIRMHQEREYPGHVIGTDLANPDFAAWARACGGHGATVTRTEEFGPAFAAARASGKPALIELKIDREAISPRATLSGLREAAQKARS